MLKTKILILAAACSLLSIAPASAHYRHHWRHHHHHYWRHSVFYRNPYKGRSQLLETNAQGDRIISGRVGLHRTIWGRMVPDSEGPGFVATGRMSRSGVSGANGLPGSDFQ